MPAHGQNAEDAAVSPKPPRNSRDLFDIFARYTLKSGLEGMLADIDFAAVEPRQIYFAVHGRAPEKRQIAVPAEGYSAMHRLIGALRSDEFRNNLLPRFLDAYPEKQRLLFIHIPKTAGSELSRRFADCYPTLSSQILQPGWGDQEHICYALHRAVVGLAHSDRLFVCGHNTLEQYRLWRAIRFQDRIFTAIRQPGPAILSQINYILQRIFDTDGRLAPDTTGWRQIFDVKDPRPVIGKAAIIDLGRRILRNQDVVPANVACKFLGDGTAATALDRIICYDVELTDTVNLDRWCLRSWGIDRQTRSNVSTQFFTADDLSPADKQHVASITAEDVKLHATVTALMVRLGSASVRGLQLA